MHQTRTVLILSSIVLACVIALYFGARWLRRELTDKPYVADVQVRILDAGADGFCYWGRN